MLTLLRKTFLLIKMVFHLLMYIIIIHFIKQWNYFIVSVIWLHFWSNFYWGIVFFLFLRCRLQRSPVVGGTTENLFRKRLLDALSWQTETWKISTTVNNWAAVDALLLYTVFNSRCEIVRYWRAHIYCVRLLCYSFYCRGQFQGLSLQNG